MTYTYSVGRRGEQLSARAEHPVAIETSYAFELPEEEGTFLFVQWAADAACDYGCCDWSYSLFQVTDALRERAWSRYDCDI